MVLGSLYRTCSLWIYTATTDTFIKYREMHHGKSGPKTTFHKPKLIPPRSFLELQKHSKQLNII